MYDILSSKSFCFLVNFQTKNAIIPIKATPPATDKPMIEPVPKPEESEGGVTGRDEAEAEAEALDEALPKKVTTIVEPPIIVKLKLGVMDTAFAEVEKKVLVLVLWEDLVLLSEDVEVLLLLVLVEVEVEVLDWEVEVDDLSIGGGETEIAWRRSKDAEARRKKKDNRREKQMDDWKDFIRKLCQQFGKWLWSHTNPCSCDSCDMAVPARHTASHSIEDFEVAHLKLC